jgi:hypothetical protein
MLETSWLGYRDYTFKCSRGVSKTFTIGSLFAPLKALLFRNARVLIASASRFRGGKLILKDSERLIMGQLGSQKLPGFFAKKAIDHPKTIKHEPDMWYMDFKTHSSVVTVPTNNEEAVRGVRATVLIIDERNTFDGEAIETVYRPFLMVGTDFANPALGASGNQTFFVGTIDYSYRDWYKGIMAIKDLAKLQYEMNKAMMSQDWQTYDNLLRQHGAQLRGMSACYLRYDYTDLLIPTKVNNYKVHYPGARPGRDIIWDDRDECEYIYSYPVNKRTLEDPLDQGIVDQDSWYAEQRNMFIQASGSVYPPVLVEKATGPVYTEKEEIKRGWDAQKEGFRYVPPVLYTCQDPCVLGVDTARKADFTALVVLRIGSMPVEYFEGHKGDYMLRGSTGTTPWSNVIWAEQHQHLTVRDTTALIHEFRKRYNIIGTTEFPGIIMDARGGGVHVRDELANPSPPIDGAGQPEVGWKQPQKIYDLDDGEFEFLQAESSAWPGLRLLMTTDLMNQELIGYSRAQMDIGRLYVGTYKPQTERNDPEFKMTPGYLGVQALKHQMLRIQAEATPSGKSVRYVMPGDPRKLENKKDMLMAFLYACYGLRFIQTLFARDLNIPEPVAFGTVLRF